jgi:hypothetical protein
MSRDDIKPLAEQTGQWLVLAARPRAGWLRFNICC